MARFIDILRKNKELGQSCSGPTYPILLMGNITVSQLTPVLEYELRSQGINARCDSADYNTILQSSAMSGSYRLIVIFWELANLIEGLQYQADLLSQEETEKLLERFRAEIDTVLTNLSRSPNGAPLVAINKFSTLVFNQHYLRPNNFDYICRELNKHLEACHLPNIFLIDIDKLIARVSIDNATCRRDFYSSKALYTVAFFEEYARHISPISRAAMGHSKKALILDCDNTLWGGIIAEDKELQMSNATPTGTVYCEVQHLFKNLTNTGIVLGLNSKNNPDDVEETFERNADMTLGGNDIVVKRINWQDKVSNLKEIAAELNIGLDSLIFIDDSEFEVNLVKQYLPDVFAVLVPANRFDYPDEVRKLFDLFLSLSASSEDQLRLRSYRDQAERQTARSTFTNINEYLASLKLQMTIHENNPHLVSRLAQLTQKTNQFNLTTKRYTETEVAHFMNSGSHIVLAFSVKDLFGDFGVTGQCIIRVDGDVAIIDTFLLSCRVLGRNLELRFLDETIKLLARRGVSRVKSAFIPTPKNSQVERFYDNANFSLIAETEQYRNYEIALVDYQYHELDYIEVNNERTN